MAACRPRQLEHAAEEGHVGLHCVKDVNVRHQLHYIAFFVAWWRYGWQDKMQVCLW